MNDFAIGLIRTWVPIWVGAFVAWTVTLGLGLDAQTSTAMIVSLTGLLQGAYYTLVRFAAKKWPGIELMLGVKTAPQYEPSPPL